MKRDFDFTFGEIFKSIRKYGYPKSETTVKRWLTGVNSKKIDIFVLLKDNSDIVISKFLGKSKSTIWRWRSEDHKCNLTDKEKDNVLNVFEKFLNGNKLKKIKKDNNHTKERRKLYRIKNRKKEKGVVYLLSNKSFDGVYKIGYTTNDIEERLKMLNNTSVPFNFEVCHIIDSDDVKLTEKYFHYIFRKSRLNKRREFFKLNEDDLKLIKSY